MTDYFTRLAARALGTAGAVQPDIMPVFADIPPSSKEPEFNVRESAAAGTSSAGRPLISRGETMAGAGITIINAHTKAAIGLQENEPAVNGESPSPAAGLLAGNGEKAGPPEHISAPVECLGSEQGMPHEVPLRPGSIKNMETTATPGRHQSGARNTEAIPHNARISGDAMPGAGEGSHNGAGRDMPDAAAGGTEGESRLSGKGVKADDPATPRYDNAVPDMQVPRGQVALRTEQISIEYAHESTGQAVSEKCTTAYAASARAVEFYDRENAGDGRAFAAYTPIARGNETITPLEGAGEGRERPHDKKAGEPAVHITIGRIHVKAVSPPAPFKERQAAVRQQSGLTLNEYLKRRSGDNH